ncbi:interferon-induced protein 44-like isoform X5 [Trematomus bernacchii]|uniref:interferon-induced protein 44-like isoform X5 n=1 Tax=Trematomus bernacchii TaxID=40690 RepID=UPI00146D98CE|nr:interferon-induced protein 44-like isoform X5 [Trematomus bernacchii]
MPPPFSFSFGLAPPECPAPAAKPAFVIGEDVKSPFTLRSNVSSTKKKEKNTPSYTFPVPKPKLESQWREMEWTEEPASFSFATPECPAPAAKPAFAIVEDVLSHLTLCSNVSSTEKEKNTPSYTFPATQPKLESQWREMEWTEELASFSFATPECPAPAAKPAFAIVEDVLSHLTLCSNVSSTEKEKNTPSYTFPATQPKLESQWREMEWTEEQKASLMKTVSSYRPSCHEGTQARVLLLGPVGSGKSSFISSVQSVFNGRVTNRAMVGTSSTSFTKKLQSFNIHGQKGEDPTGLVLCDIVGLGGGEMTGLTLHDILSVIKGHAPEGHKFSPDQPVRSETVGYIKKPGLKDKIHCVAFVVDASKILTYPKGLGTTFRLLRKHISDLDIHQVALLTQIDQICPETAKDVTQVYKSCIIQDMMNKAGDLLGMSTSYIVPVNNYSSELKLNVNNDVLLLRAVDHILQYADLYFQDNAPQHTGPKIDLGV